MPSHATSKRGTKQRASHGNADNACSYVINSKSKEDSSEIYDALILYKNLNTSSGTRLNAGTLIPYLKEHKGTLTLVLISSFVIQLLGLATPLVIQVIIDKAISQRSLDTLQILGTSLLIVALT